MFINQAKYKDILDTLDVARDPKLFDPPVMNESLKTKDRQNFVNWSREDKEEYRKYNSDLQEYRKTKSECFSLWCDTLYKLSIANHFKDETMFFPHNIDFRGRVYPIAPYFHHMGGDLSRSLLVFAKGKTLG